MTKLMTTSTELKLRPMDGWIVRRFPLPDEFDVIEVQVSEGSTVMGMGHAEGRDHVWFRVHPDLAVYRLAVYRYIALDDRCPCPPVAQFLGSVCRDDRTNFYWSLGTSWEGGPT